MRPDVLADHKSQEGPERVWRRPGAPGQGSVVGVGEDMVWRPTFHGRPWNLGGGAWAGQNVRNGWWQLEVPEWDKMSERQGHRLAAPVAKRLLGR